MGFFIIKKMINNSAGLRHLASRYPRRFYGRVNSRGNLANQTARDIVVIIYNTFKFRGSILRQRRPIVNSDRSPGAIIESSTQTHNQWSHKVSCTIKVSSPNLFTEMQVR